MVLYRGAGDATNNVSESHFRQLMHSWFIGKKNQREPMTNHFSRNQDSAKFAGQGHCGKLLDQLIRESDKESHC